MNLLQVLLGVVVWYVLTNRRDALFGFLAALLVWCAPPWVGILVLLLALYY